MVMKLTDWTALQGPHWRPDNSTHSCSGTCQRAHTDSGAFVGAFGAWGGDLHPVVANTVLIKPVSRIALSSMMVDSRHSYREHDSRVVHAGLCSSLRTDELPAHTDHEHLHFDLSTPCCAMRVRQAAHIGVGRLQV